MTFYLLISPWHKRFSQVLYIYSAITSTRIFLTKYVTTGFVWQITPSYVSLPSNQNSTMAKAKLRERKMFFLKTQHRGWCCVIEYVWRPDVRILVYAWGAIDSTRGRTSCRSLSAASCQFNKIRSSRKRRRKNDSSIHIWIVLGSEYSNSVKSRGEVRERKFIYVNNGWNK